MDYFTGLFIRLSFLRSFNKIKKIFRLEDTVYWLYLGTDIIAKRYFKKQLQGKFRMLNVSRLHNSVADELRQEYILWSDSLNRLNAKCSEWWFNNISSRDADNTNIFQHFIYLELIKMIYLDKSVVFERPKVIIVESSVLAKNIRDWLLKQNLSIEVISTRTRLLNFLSACGLLLKTYIKFIFAMFSRNSASLISGMLFKKNNIAKPPEILIDTYVRNDNLSKEGLFSDSYFPYLYQYLNKNGFAVTVHPKFFGFSFNYLPFFIKLRKSATNFIIREDFLVFSDYLKALFYPLWFLGLRIIATDFRGINTREIIKEEKLKQSFFPCMDAVLTYRLFVQLKKKDFYPAQIIQWFENQVIDKALIAGCRKSFPGVNILGAQIFMHSLNFVSLIPCESEVKANIAPDLLLETGPYQCRFVNRFNGLLPCLPAASLRYAHIFNNGNNKLSGFEKGMFNRALVLLPYGVIESVELLEAVIEAAGKLSFSLEILVKPHPITELNLVLKYLPKKRLPDNFRFFSGNLNNAFKEARLVISNASSTLAEAIAGGLAVICFGRNNALNFNPLSGIDIPFATECFSADELLSAINRYMNISQSEMTENKKIGLRLRDLLFTPVNDATLEPFISKARQKSGKE